MGVRCYVFVTRVGARRAEPRKTPLRGGITAPVLLPLLYLIYCRINVSTAATEPLIIRRASVEDASALASIYNHYLLTTAITFELSALSEEQMGGRIARLVESGYPYLVCEAEGQVVGYSYASQFRAYAAYAPTVEGTVYTDHRHLGRGIGRQLYTALIERLRTEPERFRMLMGVITLPGEASVRLHESLGFKQVAHLPRVGYKFDRWIDVGYWQLDLHDALYDAHACSISSTPTTPETSSTPHCDTIRK